MRSGELPPDPWVEEGIDLWSLEQAEELSRQKAEPDDPRWEQVGGPTIDEFYDAEREEQNEREKQEPISFRATAVIAGVLILLMASYLIYGAVR